MDDKKTTRARIISISSGKDGVGKTSVSTNLAIALAGHDKKVVVVDADTGPSNINFLVGKKAKYTITDTLTGAKEINQVLIDGPGGINIVTGSPELHKIREFNGEKKERLISAFEELEKEFDYILIDTPTGSSSTTTSFMQSAQSSVIIVSPDPASISEAYSLLKALKKKDVEMDVHVLVNMVLSYEESIKIFNKLNAATKEYLGLETQYLGYIRLDQDMITSVIQQKPILTNKPDCTTGRSFASIAGKLLTMYCANATPSLSEYWKRDRSGSVEVVQKENVAPIVPSIPNEEKKDDTIFPIVLTIPDEGGQKKSVVSSKDFSIPAEIVLTESIPPAVSSIPDDAEKEESIAPGFSSIPEEIIQEENIPLVASSIPADAGKKETFPPRVSSILEEMGSNESISIPDKVRKTFSGNGSMSMEELADMGTQLILMGKCSEEEAVDFFQRIENSFSKKFEKLPFNIKTAIYSSIEFSDFSEEKFIGLSQFLEFLYEKRFKRELHNTRDLFIKLLDESTVSEQKMKILLQLIENSFGRRFKKSIHNIKEVLMGELGREGLCEENFGEFIGIIKDIYLKRFGAPYKEPLQFPISKVENIFNKMKKQEEELNELTQKAMNLSKRKEESQLQLYQLVKDFCDEPAMAN